MIKNNLFTLILILATSQANAQSLAHSGQLSVFTAVNPGANSTFLSGLRYIPALNFTLPAWDEITIEGELSLNGYTNLSVSGGESDLSGKLEPYRGWIKLSGKRFEVRAGLQKINFGSASMLRSLMWFDRMDARDPLQLTGGVYGLLGRYYFSNNANIWLWGLYGNSEPRGWDYLKSDSHRPEFGGRLQLPIPSGEMAFSYHNRKIDDILPAPDDLFPDLPLYHTEQKIGFDIRADIVIGIWAEATVKRSNGFRPEWERMLTLGSDYTFGIGNGVSVTAEYLTLASAGNLTGESVTSDSFVALSANYPLSVISTLSGMVYINPADGDLYRFLNLSLVFDRFSYYLIGYWNPDSYKLFNTEAGSNPFNGKGFNIMIVLNY
ncbi:MAG: hypothetical protein ABR519_03305 [Bacteroidales bacterium]